MRASGKRGNAPEGRDCPTEGRVVWPACGVALGLRYTYRGANRAWQAGQTTPVKWIKTRYPWYKLVIVMKFAW
jgi:hypothetical protein